MKKALLGRISWDIAHYGETTLSASELRLLNIEVKELEYDHFSEADSPKGEFVPGTRDK